MPSHTPSVKKYVVMGKDISFNVMMETLTVETDVLRIAKKNQDTLVKAAPPLPEVSVLLSIQLELLLRLMELFNLTERSFRESPSHICLTNLWLTVAQSATRFF